MTLVKGGDILAVGGGGFSNVLGSVRRGSLVLEAGAKDALRIGLTKSRYAIPLNA